MNNIIFYTLIYKIKSKFDFKKYEEWGSNLIKNMKDQLLVIYTDQNTYDILKNYLKSDNIKVIFLELNEFKYYKYIDFFEKCTSLTDGFNIDAKLLLIWLERVILLDNLKNLIKSEFYSFVDFGYFRDDKIYDNFLKNNILLNKEKIYYCLIKNDNIYLKNNILSYYNNNKEYPIKNDGIIGGGFFIIHNNKISLYLSLFENKVLLYISNNRLIKDDQIIITDIIFDKNNTEYFELITDIDSHLNIIYKNKIIQNNNFNDFINSVYYSKLIFKNNNKDILYKEYININEDIYKIKDFDDVINYKNDDNWFVFKKFLNDNDYNKYIINDYKLLLYDYYLVYDVNYDIYYESNIIKVMKNNFNMYIFFKKNIDILNYLILFELLSIFINIQVLNINSTYNDIDYEFIVELSKIFNFSIIINR
jgi:hypothetical protein